MIRRFHWSKFRLFVEDPSDLGDPGSSLDNFSSNPLPANLYGGPGRARVPGSWTYCYGVAFDPAATSYMTIKPGDGNRNPYLRTPGRHANLFPRKACKQLDRLAASVAGPLFHCA